MAWLVYELQRYCEVNVYITFSRLESLWSQ